jgi:hypothetical protein
MRIKSTDTLVTTAVAKRRRSLPAEGTLPWGTPLRGLTVAEFAMSFRKHLPLVRANLVAAPSDRVLNGICHGLSNRGAALRRIAAADSAGPTGTENEKTTFEGAKLLQTAAETAARGRPHLFD